MRVLLTALLVVLALPGAAAAQTVGPCGVGAGAPECEYETGKVTFIGDGDTMSVDLDDDGTKTPIRVRITGIDTMEQTYYTHVPKDRRGECHAGEATERLESLVKSAKGRVRLMAMDPESTSRGRSRRAVAVKIRGTWRDVGRIMLKEGHAHWLPQGSEWAWNYSYSVLAQRAQRQGVGLWNPEHCLPGPYDTTSLRLWANPDPEQTGRAETEGEWIRIKNLDPGAPRFIGGWWVRDSGLRRYVFPRWTYIPAGGTVTVHIGQGVDSEFAFYWNLRKPIFDNVSGELGTGDGAYLFDFDGDLRASMQYPCRYECADPAQGALDIKAFPKRRDEFVTVRNIGPAPVDMEGYRLYTRPYVYAFGADSVIGPGEEMRVNVKGDPAQDTRLEKNWGRSSAILGNAGDKVDVSTFTSIRLACTAWGSAYC